jgi:predicted nucleotide-binding protein (sugar kinase/HSP70/actin superfamily)
MRYTQEFIDEMRDKQEERRMQISKMSQTEVMIDTKYIIEFEDFGQDFLKWYIDKEGIVLHSEPLQSWVWCGHFTIPQSAVVGEKLAIWNNGESYVNYPIKSIEKVNKKVKDLEEKE